MFISVSFFFFNDTATTEIYTLSLHDALPICATRSAAFRALVRTPRVLAPTRQAPARDRKSTRLNSSHLGISYAVFCLKKKKKTKNDTRPQDTIRDQVPTPTNTTHPRSTQHNQ